MVDRVSGVVSFERASFDLARVGQELNALQRQTATGRKAEDLKSFGSAAGLIISARSELARTEARIETVRALEARLSVQDLAIGRAHDAAAGLRQAIQDALASDDGRGLGQALELAVSEASAAFNTTWAGQYVFGGERVDAPPVIADTPERLVLYGDHFQSSDRPQVADYGDGVPRLVAETARTLGQDLLQSFASLHRVIGSDAEALGETLTQGQRDSLLELSNALEDQRNDLALARGANGDRQNTVDEAIVRLTARSDTLTKSIGEQVDADLAEVAIQLSQKQTQYEAVAATIAQLRDVSLLNYLR